MHNLGLERTGDTYLLNGGETLLVLPPTLQLRCTDLTGDRGGGGARGLFSVWGMGTEGWLEGAVNGVRQ